MFASIIAPFGGFFASGFKRGFKIKDFGDSIPGHGGMTDRMDCQVITLPDPARVVGERRDLKVLHMHDQSHPLPRVRSCACCSPDLYITRSTHASHLLCPHMVLPLAQRACVAALYLCEVSPGWDVTGLSVRAGGRWSWRCSATCTSIAMSRGRSPSRSAACCRCAARGSKTLDQTLYSATCTEMHLCRSGGLRNCRQRLQVCFGNLNAPSVPARSSHKPSKFKPLSRNNTEKPKTKPTNPCHLPGASKALGELLPWSRQSAAAAL